MSKHFLTLSERNILNNVDSAPDKVASADDVRRAVHLTPRGFRRVLTNMVNDRIIGLMDGGKITMTFAGMQAIKK